MKKNNLQQYKDAIVQNYHKPYIMQPLNGNWYTVNRFINDDIIRRHIEHEIWAGVLAPYYPQWGILDFDNPHNGIIEKTIEQLGMQKGQYLLTTSPSYKTDGSTHLLIKPELDDHPPTIKQYLRHLNCALNTCRGQIEVYPKISNGIRLPFGLKQHILADNIPLHYLSLSENIHWFDKLETFDLSHLQKFIHNQIHNLDSSLFSGFPEPDINSKNEGAFLYRKGLQAERTRHNATKMVLIWLFTINYPPEIGISLTREWIETKHNGLSRKINSGRWDEVYVDISKLAEWVYLNLEHYCIYPDSVHNGQYCVYESDIRFIAEVFPGQICKLKKLFNLILH